MASCSLQILQPGLCWAPLSTDKRFLALNCKCFLGTGKRIRGHEKGPFRRPRLINWVGIFVKRVRLPRLGRDPAQFFEMVDSVGFLCCLISNIKD